MAYCDKDRRHPYNYLPARIIFPFRVRDFFIFSFRLNFIYQSLNVKINIYEWFNRYPVARDTIVNFHFLVAGRELQNSVPIHFTNHL